ncbi:VIR protein [Plasmodium vivax]|uniref:VIR protein n=1 Tax=Plasmodium vivax TaxID=5855 RepID=A0A1G4GT47_PLAVI|nr:VIR protein [Plasmodium vivax]
MTLFYCKEINKTDSKDNEFEPRCGTKIFIPILSNFNHVKGQYLNHINEIKDPILRHISIYFVQYYIDGYHYYRESGLTHRNAACQYLKQWLQEKKDLFTYGERCNTKKELWESKFESLWNIIKNDNTISKKNENNPWCTKTTLSGTTTYPDALTSPNCEERISQESSSTYVPPLTVTEKCECLQNADHEIPSQAVQPPETDRTKNLVVTSGFTAFGTLGTLLVLYKFTPMSSWFRRRGMNNVGTDLYMGPGAADSFLRMQHDNGGNNLFYHSSIE